MLNFKKPIPQRVPKENCKIKIKNTKAGKQIEFSSSCTKEQVEMAKMLNGTNNAVLED